MGSRTIERGMARALYDEFSRKWRSERRLAGKEGVAGYRKPTFGQWHRMHLRNLEMMRQATPVDVQEYLGIDPWAEGPGDGNLGWKDDEAARAAAEILTVPTVGADASTDRR